jgi:hypothetical protein
MAAEQILKIRPEGQSEKAGVTPNKSLFFWPSAPLVIYLRVQLLENDG